jgi:hypothetical protein
VTVDKSQVNTARHLEYARLCRAIIYIVLEILIIMEHVVVTTSVSTISIGIIVKNNEIGLSKLLVYYYSLKFNK